MTAALDAVRQIAADSQWLAAFATTRDDGSVHASLLSAGGVDDPVTGETCVGAVAGLVRPIFRAAGGTHAGWDEFDRARVAGRRTEMLIRPHRIMPNR
jgi:hypothetical protein